MKNSTKNQYKNNHIYSSSRFMNLVFLLGIISISIIACDPFVIAISIILIVLLIMQDFNYRNIKSLNKELIETHKDLSKELYTDHLTGLPNSKSLQRDLFEKSVLIINIDRFSAINSVYGIENGNIVIKKLASLLQNIIENAEVYYFRIDEFAITFDQMLNHDELANKIYTEVQKLDIYINDVPIKIDITMGISKDNKDQVEKAINALKHAKKYNKLYSVFSNEVNLSQENEKKLYWIKVAQEALLYDTLTVYAQPVVDQNENVMSYELLMRIKMGANIILPQQFLPIIKETKIYREMTKTIIIKAFEFFKDRNDNFSINLSTIDILDDDMKNFMVEKLKEYDIGRKVIFEILEDETIEDFEQVKGFLDSVKKYGVRIGIDNFGSGYSNFLHITQLNIDYLKIDKTIIRNIEHDFYTQNIIKAIVRFSKDMGVKSVAQFVSNKAIFEITKELGVNEFQGYYFSKPQNMLKLDKIR